MLWESILYVLLVFFSRDFVATVSSPGQLEGEDGQQMTYTEHLMKLKDELSEAQTANQQAKLKLSHSQSSIKKMEAESKKVRSENRR